MPDNEIMPRVVLVVEDSEYCAATLEIALLAIPDVAVNRFANGADALRFLLADPRNVRALITDLHLPVMNGFELIQQVRSDRRVSGLPILVVSGDTDPETPERVCRLGANAFFSKPFSPAAVKNKLEQLLDASPP